jgi:hypothetical protein
MIRSKSFEMHVSSMLYEKPLMIRSRSFEMHISLMLYGSMVNFLI